MGSEDGRRKLLKALGLVGAGAAIQQGLPVAWIKPVMDAMVPSAHAQENSSTPTASPILPSVTPTQTPTPTPSLPAPSNSATPTPTPSPPAPSNSPVPTPTPSSSPIPPASPTPTPSPQPIIFKDRFQSSGP